VNDMQSSLTCRLALYADDSALVASGKDVAVIGRFLSAELERCGKWLIDNRLSLHLGKTEAILFGTRRKISKSDDFVVMCGDSPVVRVSSIKYLGVHLDAELSFGSHVGSILNKCSSRLAFLYRQAGVLSGQSRRTLCSALIQPYMFYCCSAWSQGISCILREKLLVMQRKMVRFVLFKHNRDHVGQEELDMLGWLSFTARVSYFRLTHVYRIHNEMAPEYLSENFKRVSQVHDHKTRGSDLNYFVPRQCSGAISKSFYFNAIKEWNALPDDLKSCRTEVIFKRELRKYLAR
jgi:hypothetical protein